MVAREHDFVARVGARGVAGFGEGYVAGDWSTEDLPAVLYICALGLKRASTRPTVRFYAAVRDAVKKHERTPKADAAANAAWHYDLPVAFFRTFLDESLTYSSGYFESWSDSLLTAQLNKINRALDLGGVRAGSRVLEIGSGWGRLAVEAGHRGAEVTAINVAPSQLRAAAELAVTSNDLRVEFRQQDYREVDGTFDVVVSIEMLEAVGLGNIPEFFAKVAAKLQPGGRLVLQFIYTSETAMKLGRERKTWVKTYIFPGGDIPSKRYVLQSATQSRLALSSTTELGEHYAHTLKLWRSRLVQSRERGLLGTIDESFFKMWEYYLAMSEAGFRAGHLGCAQWCLTRV